MMETLKGKEFYEGDNPLEELSINGDSESDEDFLGSEENCIVERVSNIMFSHYLASLSNPYQYIFDAKRPRLVDAFMGLQDKFTKTVGLPDIIFAPNYFFIV